METFKPEAALPESNEGLKKYTYRDNHDNRKVVFECEAPGILEADELYRQATGKNVEKQPHIAVDFKNVEEE